MATRRSVHLTLPALLAALLVGGLSAAWGQAAKSDSLYKRLGGYDALAAVTDDFIARLAGDAELKRFFVGHSENSLAHIRQLIVDQLCAVTGGPCVYVGRDMKTAHQGLGITEKDWESAVNHLVATFGKFKVGEKEKGEVLAVLTTLKGDIVDSPQPAAGKPASAR